MSIKIPDTKLTKEGFIIKKTKTNKDMIENIKKELTVEPYQVYKQANVKPVKFPVFQENDDYIVVPKFYGIEKFGKPKVDMMEKGKPINIIFNSKLKPNQVEIVDNTIKHIDVNGGGLICAGCGVGKTVMGLYLACHYKVKTLIIVHKTFLLNQWKERIEQFTNAKVGIIQQNRIEVEDKDIVIGMLQSIARDKYDSDIFMDFGFVIFDEAHHAPSEYFSRALPTISCNLSLGLSATPKRADKMEKILYWYLGEIAYIAPPNKNDSVIVRAYNYDVKDKNYKEARLPYTGEINRPKTLNRIVMIEQRNTFIIDLLKEIMLEPERKILLLSDRIEHLDTLKKLIDNIDGSPFSCEYYIGGMTQKKLDIASNAQIILGSYGMASEGLDIPTLNTLIMATPRREVEQSVGRIIRKANHLVQPLIIDIVDMLPSFVNQGIYRRKLYKKLNYNIEVYEVENSVIVSKIELNNTIDISEIKEKKEKKGTVDFID
jgi:superfamily II DNA or RNA helicase